MQFDCYSKDSVYRQLEVFTLLYLFIYLFILNLQQYRFIIMLTDLLGKLSFDLWVSAGWLGCFCLTCLLFLCVQ